MRHWEVPSLASTSPLRLSRALPLLQTSFKTTGYFLSSFLPLTASVATLLCTTKCMFSVHFNHT